MNPPGSARPSATSDHLPVLLFAVAVLGGIMWVTTPELGSFPGALIPWPAHGIAMAILLATPTAARVRVGVALTLMVLVVCTANALRIDGTIIRVAGATMLLVGQTFFTVILYDRLAKGAFPLSGTVPYAYALAAAVLGSVPMTVGGAVALDLFGDVAAPDYSGWAWWVAASSSGAALLGGTLVLLPGPRRIGRAKSKWTLEFAALVATYAFALTSAFAERGPFAAELPPALAALPFLVWAGMRFGVRGFGVLAALLTVFVITTTWLDVGPFARFEMPRSDRFRRAWVYLASMVGPAMIFPVALAERARSERRAKANLAQLSQIIEGASDLIAAVDRDLAIIAANPSWIAAYERLTGVPFRHGMRLTEPETRVPGDLETSLALWSRALAGERFTVLREIAGVSGLREHYEVTYSPVVDERGEVVGGSQVLRDISARQRLEAEQAESRRLESVGRLAGGVAHDFNNLMTAVMGYSELIRATLGAGDPRADDLGEIERAAARAGELTQQLLAFARRREVHPREVDAGSLVLGITRLLAPLIGTRVTLEVRALKGLRPVRLDPTQFEQVVLNLAVNARDAMPGGGVLLIEAYDDVREGVAGVRLRVKDDGVGMSPEVKERLFEPFFTTKKFGEGTGLGLATVHGIVKQAGA